MIVLEWYGNEKPREKGVKDMMGIRNGESVASIDTEREMYKHTHTIFFFHHRGKYGPKSALWIYTQK